METVVLQMNLLLTFKKVGCMVFNRRFLRILQIGEEMSQNSFIKQYLAKQQELLRQRMEREAREAAEADGKTRDN